MELLRCIDGKSIPVLCCQISAAQTLTTNDVSSTALKHLYSRCFDFRFVRWEEGETAVHLYFRHVWKDMEVNCNLAGVEAGGHKDVIVVACIDSQLNPEGAVHISGNTWDECSVSFFPPC